MLKDKELIINIKEFAKAMGTTHQTLKLWFENPLLKKYAKFHGQNNACAREVIINKDSIPVLDKYFEMKGFHRRTLISYSRLFRQFLTIHKFYS